MVCPSVDAPNLCIPRAYGVETGKQIAIFIPATWIDTRRKRAGRDGPNDSGTGSSVGISTTEREVALVDVGIELRYLLTPTQNLLVWTA